MSLSVTPFINNFLPLQVWTSFEREMDHNLAHMHGILNDATHHHADRHRVHRQPNYSYEEDYQKACLEVELPGVVKENVEIDLQGNNLIISAKRFRPGTGSVGVSRGDSHQEKQVHGQADGNDDNAEESKEKDNQLKPFVVYLLKLCIGHKFDSDNIQASMEGDGILRMLLPTKKKDTPRPIQIQPASM